MNKQETLLKLGQEINTEFIKNYNSKLDFSVACDVDEKTIRRILKGQQNLSMGIFLKICEELKLKSSDLFKRIDL